MLEGLIIKKEHVARDLPYSTMFRYSAESFVEALRQRKEFIAFSGPLFLRIDDSDPPRIYDDDPYSRAVDRSSKISIHFRGTRKDLPGLPKHIRRVGRLLDAANIAEERPYIVGVTHEAVARLAVHFGMTQHEQIGIQPVKRRDIEEVQDAAAAMYGRPPTHTRISAVSIPTQELIDITRENS